MSGRSSDWLGAVGLLGDYLRLNSCANPPYVYRATLRPLPDSPIPLRQGGAVRSARRGDHRRQQDLRRVGAQFRRDAYAYNPAIYVRQIILHATSELVVDFRPRVATVALE